MRGKKALSRCGLGMVLAVVAATTNPSFGGTVFATGNATTICCLGPDHWYESIDKSGSPTLEIDSTYGLMFARVGAAARGSSWGIVAGVFAAATEESFGARADGSVRLKVTDRITPTLPAGVNPTDQITYTQHLHIDGTTSGSATAPGYFLAVASIRVEHTDAGGNLVILDRAETLTSDLGYLETMPRGDVSWTVVVTPNVQYELDITFEAFALAYGIDDQGTGAAKSDFGSTFRWGEVTDVLNFTTGKPIPAEDFHLYGEDGFDWAHPSAVPEPSALALVGLAAVSLLWQRKCRGGKSGRDIGEVKVMHFVSA